MDKNILKSILGFIKGFKPEGNFSYDFNSSPQPTQAQAAPPPSVSPVQMAQQVAPQQATSSPNQIQAAQQLSQQPNSFKYIMGQHDYSTLKPQVQNLLKGTPLEPYTDNFIQAGNQHGIDPRVLITIANNESSLGKNYPQDTYNPFGYNARSAGNIIGPDGKSYVNTDQGLRNAGFTSLPMAIDRLTGRFERQPTEGYKNFYQNPTIENLQAAYNAQPDERSNYIKNAMALLGQQ